MKTIIRTVLCAVALMLTAACQKAVDPVNPVDEGKGTIDIRVNGLMGEYTQVDGTKSSMVNTVRISWENDDIVYVFDGTQCLGSLVASLEGDEDRYALLSTNEEHTVAAPAEGTTKLTLIHSPLLTEAPAVSDGAVSISLAEQSGAKAPFVAYATLDYTGTTITNAIVPFKFATSVIKVNCTGLTANTAIDNATLSNVNTACKLTLSGTAAPTVSGGANGTITRTGDTYFAAGKVNSEGEAVFQIAVPALESASEARVLTVTQGLDKVKDKKFTTKSLDPATSVNTVCQLVLVVLPVDALRGEFTVGPNATDKVHFSKGNLVATIDATGAPTAWKFATNQYDYIGEVGANKTIGSKAGDVDLFGWSASNNGGTSTTDNYGIKTSTSSSDYSGDFYDWGKAYCTSKSITPDSTWRTLSTAEWQYLFNTRSNASNLYKCGVTVCGKTDCVVLLPDNWQWDASTVGTSWQTEYPETSTESNPVTWERMEKAGAVCLPSAGGRNGSLLFNVGYGYYWSSTAYGGDRAYRVFFNNGDVNPVNYGTRSYGYSVRLVTNAE